eukprot:CAMPEP_0176380538 /NCGR_PEP_ID=MMETSP0126-20121128/31207_1 /TAXON_ID=141414 ORGANISM="Strombidinopsis acuminatum, Strain SPMC142" /NCGR_SAMPLE_ID=MMETSP0126 /ASSEMBLY_ACC=CAM_ASM_000229 /LENGTH=73 /DNA_ID=CAMNT_0017743913 /DNA_START=260 /DNA_END=481 /DNA_ORIENTATION=+
MAPDGKEMKSAYHGENPRGNFKPDFAQLANDTYLYKPTAYFDNGVLAAVGATYYDPNEPDRNYRSVDFVAWSD